MKLRCAIISATDNGDEIALIVQGRQKGGARWRGEREMKLILPMHDKTARAFYVGRIITVEVKT